MTDLYWDPFTPALRDDPYPLWKRLRDEAPVYHNERHDFWVLSRFEDIAAAHRDPLTFSSAHGVVIEMMKEDADQSGQMMIMTDPPLHTVLRSLVSRAFTGRRVALLEERIRSVTVGLLDAQLGAPTFDYVQDFAAILPPTIISSLLGVPERDQEWLRPYVDGLFHVDEEHGMVNDVAVASGIELHRYLGEQFDERRRRPRDDMFSDLLQAEITHEGERRRLTEGELVAFGIMLFVAGTETVARHLGWVADVLAANPVARAELAADHALVPGAIEEILRLEPPSPVNGRWTTGEVTLHGTTIPAGSKVVLLTGSAGRDERQFTDPDALDIRRAIDLHLTFGYGIHFCLGAALARMEGRIGLEETLRRWPEWEVDRASAVPLYTSTVRGWLNLPFHGG